MNLYKRVCMWADLVGRVDMAGSRIGPRFAWKLAGIFYP